MKKTYLATLFAILISLTLCAQANASLFYIWTDTDFDGIRDLQLGSINSYEGTETGKNNYDYFSFSAHPSEGPVLNAHKLKIFVYERTTNNHEFLNIIAGKDEAGHNHWHSYSLDIDISGSDNDPRKAKGDEGHEFSETSEDHFEGDWRFKKNTDGGLIGGLFGDWEAKITFNGSDLNKHVFASNGDENVGFDEELANEYSMFWITKTSELPVGANVVPEPATMLLFGSGMAGMFLRRRKRV